MSAQTQELVEVRLLELPIPMFLRSEEHHAELLREFSHIAHSDADMSERIPDRLLALVARIRAQYQPFSGPVRDELEAARAAGREQIDAVYVVPRDVKDVAAHLEAELQEADRFCRSGDLLTLATPPDVLRFRRWFLQQFVCQAEGAPPTPWSEYREG